MTRMERRRRRRRILRIKLATTAAVLAMTTASIVALTGGAAETVPEPTPQPPALQAEPVLLVAEHDSTYQPVQMTADPYQNIRSGVFILSDLYGKYGDWHKALICYNYGEGGAQEHVFSKGYTTTSYSRTVMEYADAWAEVLA